MKKLIFGLMTAAALGLAGCEKSIDSEVKDVREAEQNAAENIKDKERELQDTKLEEGKKILDEKRDVNDAINEKVKDNLNNDPNVVPAPVVPPANP